MGSNPIVSTIFRDPESTGTKSFQVFLFVSESCIDDSFDDNYERTYTYDNVGNFVEMELLLVY